MARSKPETKERNKLARMLNCAMVKEYAAVAGEKSVGFSTRAARLGIATAKLELFREASTMFLFAVLADALGGCSPQQANRDRSCHI